MSGKEDRGHHCRVGKALKKDHGIYRGQCARHKDNALPLSEPPDPWNPSIYLTINIMIS